MEKGMITDSKALQAFWASMDDDEYEQRVQAYEEQGMTRSDAQAIVECEMMQGK